MQKLIKNHRLITPRISVIICACNRANKLRSAISSYSNQTLDRNEFEIVLVNDGSSDETREVMLNGLDYFYGTYIEHTQNRGLAAAKNSGIGAARGKYVVFANDDTLADSKLLEGHLLNHDRLSNKLAVSLGDVPFTKELENKVYYRALYDYNLYTPFIGLQELQPLPFDHFIGTNTCFPRSAFLNNNIWFDESYQTYGAEDLECGYRLAQLGYNAYYTPTAKLFHDHEMDIKYYRDRGRNIGINLLHLINKHKRLLGHFLQVEEITLSLLDSWQKHIESSKNEAESLSKKLDEVRHNELVFDSEISARTSYELVDAFAKGLHFLFDYDKKKAYLETFNNNSEIRNNLLVDN